MITDIDGNEIGVGDTILICNAKDYGWLARYNIIGETPTLFKLRRKELDTYPSTVSIEKQGCTRRALKC